MEILVIAYVFDLLIGDPRWMPHPVRLIGYLIGRLEGIVRAITKEKAGLIAGGAMIAVITVVGVYLTFYVLDLLIEPLKTYHLFGDMNLYMFIAGIIGSFSLALRGLISEVNEVLEEIAKNNIPLARKRLSNIVGRDTKYLDRDGIIRALIETLSENASDGVIAPLFYFAIGGFPLAFAYKAVNTLDSMLGYKNERYRYIGMVAARIDDIANYIPARLTAVVFLFSIVILMPFYRRLDLIRAVKVLTRDARKHPSPNAGVPEATVAGALGLVLLGPAFYDGVLHHKPFIGEGGREPEIRDVQITMSMVALSSFLLLLLMTWFVYL